MKRTGADADRAGPNPCIRVRIRVVPTAFPPDGPLRPVRWE